VVVDVAGAGTALVFLSLACLHIYWAFGGRTGASAAVPEIGDRPLFSPSKAATLVVALLLATSAVIVVGGLRSWDPRPLFELGGAGVAAVLLARSIGDRRYVGVLKRVKGTDFARRDTWIYSPLCLALAIATAAVAFSR
jgi:hypothetical protein